MEVDGDVLATILKKILNTDVTIFGKCTAHSVIRDEQRNIHLCVCNGETFIKVISGM